MAFRTISVVLSANARSLNAAMYQAARSIDAFAGGVEGKGARSLIKFGAAATAVTLGAYGFERALTASVRAAVQFDASMRNVNSISHLSEQQLASLGGQVLDLSKQLPQSANQLAQGLYDIASSGFQGADGLNVLKASAQAASAGITDTQTSARAIVAVLNAYGLSADKAGAVSDSLFQTVNVGVVSFEELANTLGDVVGTAAQAGVDINEVGSAIATMTLSGISAAESTTSLNRLLQELIAPSKAMSTLFGQLGYESGVAALKSRGLHGVMEDIRKATGGNITALQALFPDIRGLRGALALLSDEGRNYNRVARQIENENNRQGATHRALAEQLKSVQAQWDIFQNRAQAVAIEAATKLLPSLIQLMQVMTNLGQDAGPVLAGAMSDLAPFFKGVHDIGVDIVTVLGDLAQAASPVARALAQIAAAGIIGSLDALATIVADLTGFLADHKTLVEGVAIIYLSRFIPAITAAVRELGLMIVLGIDAMLERMGAAAAASTAEITAMNQALRATALLESAATLGATVAFLGVVNAMHDLKTATADVSAQIDKANGQFNLLDPQSSKSASALAQLTAIIDEQGAAWHKNRNAAGLFKLVGQELTPGENSVANAIANTNAALAEREALLNASARAMVNVNQAAIKLDLPLTTGHGRFTQDTKQLEQLRELAARLNLGDALAGPPSEAEPAMRQLIRAWQALGHGTGLTTKQIADNVGIDIDKIQAFTKAVQDVEKKTREAFAGASDVFANFHPEQAAEATKAAAKGLQQARADLADLQSRTGKQAASEKDLADARQKVADAQTAVNKAQQEGDLRVFYAKQIGDARTFVANITEATRRGLDPAFITRALQQGPEVAGPILEQLVSDHSNRLIQLTNDSEKALRRISERAVEIARLTQLAVASNTDKLANELPKAQRIALERMAEGRGATAKSVAKALGLDADTVSRIAADFGITLAREIRRHAPHVTIPVHVQGEYHFGRNRALASGGYISGPGTGTSDSILARVSHGEYVVKAAAVEKYGRHMLDAVNTQRFPRFAAGGPVDRYPRLPGYASGGSVDRRQWTSNDRSINGPITVVAHDYDDFRRQLDDDAYFGAVTGGVR